MAEQSGRGATVRREAEGLGLRDLAVGGSPNADPVLLDIDLPAGGVLILVGDPDAAPTAVLRVIAGLDAPLSGHVRVGSVGLVTRQHHLLGSLTAAENVMIPLLRMPRPVRVDGQAVETQLERLGVPESGWHNLLEQLSGGQQQRVAVARALIGRPDVLCLDDPTSELDQDSADVVWREIEAARADGGCIVTTAVTRQEAGQIAARFAPGPGPSEPVIREIPLGR